jgi:hypothetical protein
MPESALAHCESAASDALARRTAGDPLPPDAGVLLHCDASLAAPPSARRPGDAGGDAERLIRVLAAEAAAAVSALLLVAPPLG